MDFESELAENELEFMAKDMRTQPTSQKSILKSPNIDFGFLLFVVFWYFFNFVCVCVFHVL